MTPSPLAAVLAIAKPTEDGTRLEIDMDELMRLFPPDATTEAELAERLAEEIRQIVDAQLVSEFSALAVGGSCK